MLAEAYISHSTGGRIRIKVPSKKGDRSYFQSLKEQLAQFTKLPGIQRVEVNPLTGSILVLHSVDPQIMDFKAITQYTETNNLFKLKIPEASQTPVFQSMTEAVSDLGGKVKGFTAGQMDLSTLAFLAFLGVAVVQMRRGNIMVPAMTALWYAFTLLKEQQIEDKLDKLESKKDQKRTKLKVQEV
jgi:hypothetical protein